MKKKYIAYITVQELSQGLYLFVRPIYLYFIEILSRTHVQIEITDLFVKFSEVF